jgi:hypothetical protein
MLRRISSETDIQKHINHEFENYTCVACKTTTLLENTLCTNCNTNFDRDIFFHNGKE